MSGGGERFQCGEIADDETGCRSGDKSVAFEPAHDADGGFGGRAHHVGHILPGQSHGELDALGIRHPVLRRQIDQERSESLVGAVQGQDFGFFLGFVETIAEVFDDLNRGFGIAAQHLEVGFLVHAQDADVAHRLRGAGMAGPLERSGVAAKEVAGHQHLQRAFFSFRARLDAFDRAFLHDVEGTVGSPSRKMTSFFV